MIPQKNGQWISCIYKGYFRKGYMELIILVLILIYLLDDKTRK